METLEFQLVPEVSLVVNDTPALQRSSGLCLAKVVEDSLTGEEKHLDGALRQIIELIQQVTKQWGGRKIMSFENITRFRMFFYIS